MIACVCHQQALHKEFETLLPRITTYLRCCFRFIRCEATRNDFVAESIGLCWKWFIRTKAQGKQPAEFVVALVRYAARAVRAGRRVCGQEKGKDAMSRTAKIQHRIVVLRFARGLPAERILEQIPDINDMVVYEEHVTGNAVTPVPDQVAFRIDWPMFLETLTPRDRSIAALLALGHQATDAAREFKLSLPRISQVRKDWQRRWREFHMESV